MSDKVTIADVYKQVESLREDIEKKYVTKIEFTPVKSIVYGLVALILMSVATAIVATVVMAF